MNGQIQLVTGDVHTQNHNSFFKDVIGQEDALRKLSFFIDTDDKDMLFPTMLFTGSHGLGKTYVARKVAEGMGRRFVEANCGMISKDEDLIEDILLGRVVGDTPVTLFFDEAHRLTTEVTTILLTLLNPTKQMSNLIHYKGWEILFDMTKIHTILATTDAHRMASPLLDRCESIYFESYSKDELIAMLSLYCPGVTLSCDLDDLSYACRGRGRDTFRLAQKIKRALKIDGKSELDDKVWKYLKDVFGIFPMGLNRQEVDLLRIVNDKEPISCANLALTMMLNTDNIESEIEVRPRELGLIDSTTRGRVLSQKGKDYMRQIR